MPSPKTFSIKEALSFGFKTAKENFFFWAGTLLFLFVVGFLANWISDKTNLYVSGIASLMVGLIIAAVSIILKLGLLRIALDFAEQEKPSFSRLFSQHPLFFKYALALIIYNILVAVGLIIFIFPGIILAVGLMFYSYLIIDLGLGPIKALKKSWAISRGVKWRLFGFSILAGLINILGALLLLVGLLITLPTTLIATAYVYRKLLAAESGSADIHPAPSAPKEILGPAQHIYHGL